MLGEHLVVVGDVPAVEIGDTKVEQYIKKVGEIENGEILSVRRITEHVLHLAVDAHYPERLHQQVEKQQENDILDETVLHLLVTFRTQK